MNSLVPLKWRFEVKLALRHLTTGGGQTLLTVGAVAAGVIVIIFLTALIFGIRARLTTMLTESIPHVTLRVRDLEPVPLSEIQNLENAMSSTRIEKQAPQLKFIDNWQHVIDVVRTVPNVRVASPAVQGQGFASRGGNPIGVSITGADPAQQDEISPVTKDLIAGRFVGLASDEVVIDYELAKDLSVAVGDRIRMTSSMGNTESLSIAGIYSRGQGRGGAYVTLRTGQSLFAMGNSVNVVYVKVYELFGSDQVADRIESLVPYEARSWSREFPSFVSSLNVQAASAYLISGFSLIASSFAIASVLIVSVLQKSKQIGILKSIGATRSQILRVFTLEGLAIAFAGSISGAIVGSLLVYLISLPLQTTSRPGHVPDQLFPVAILPVYIFGAMGAAILSTVIAAWFPARRAAKMNPVDVMR
ncbi:lipoprotein-releasing system permease protein [Edaphobacter aggregans]|uniref:Lipoprotein-releasing system permease protein n=1 Tax=Edaphobacter aggregans TaxID=570835 RepID=A0A428MHP9_9BACT|nr:FtsX-like permease family protein [Edaphobacter aggregans]RSL16471.1 lipoprotein-releasing system permease protein [Edaphobacter aggregans]